MVTVSVVTAIAVPICLGTGGGVNAAAVCSLIGLLASYAFATPPAMPCVAIAGSSGWTSAGALVRYGFLLMLASVLICVFLGYPGSLYGAVRNKKNSDGISHRCFYLQGSAVTSDQR